MNNADSSTGVPVAHGSRVPATETRLPSSLGLDAMSTLELLQLMNDQDMVAVEAVGAVLPEVAELAELGARCLRDGGRIHYFGAGTSGRLGVLDAAELLPTFNLEPDIVVAHIAGGAEALTRAIENSEDSEEDGAAAAITLGPLDLAIGLTASGNTPYVGGALRQARYAGASTALVSCNVDASLAPLADRHIVLNTGAEVITGSTRLKAGSAEKMLLNGFSTAVMVAHGRTWSNLMVSVVATNEKLRRRTVRILLEATELSEKEGLALLEATGGDLRVALVAFLGDRSPEEAKEALAAARNSVRDALSQLSRQS